MPKTPTPAPKNFREGRFAYHEEIEVRIDALTNLGKGLARVDGWVVFIPFALPGELVRARVYSNRANYSEADLIEILDPSPHRVEPRCRLFGDCGGCQYQQFDYPAQLDWKQRQVRELLQHMAGIEHSVEAVIPSPEPYGYRSKLTPHFAKPRGGTIDAIGFLREGRRSQLVDVPECPIAMPAINEALTQIRASVRKRAAKYKKGATLLLRASSESVITDPVAVACEIVGELRFEFPAGDFFQNNPFILPEFTRHVAAEAAATGCRVLIDAYCGSGLFSLTAATRFERVVGIEVSESSIEWARRNAAANQIENAVFQAGKVEDLFGGVDATGAESAVIIDPPRKGCSADFLAQLFRLGPARVVYVSCNPATQMRDLRQFVDAGYRLVTVQPFDLFPQTRHLECVMTLQSAQNSGETD